MRCVPCFETTILGMFTFMLALYTDESTALDVMLGFP